MRYLITGGAGFIGSNLADRLLAEGQEVVVYDNLSTGKMEFLSLAIKHPGFKFIQGDILDKDKLTKSLDGIDFVVHFSANADVRFGVDQPGRDLEQNTIGTFNVLEAMRANNVKKIAFSSTGSVYGEAVVIPTPETAAFPIQTSLYGASKVAGEGLIAAYCEGFGFQSWLFRFVSILGERYTHGHIFDFYKKLKKDPGHLDVLGNGKQKKSYLYVKDCMDAMMTAFRHSTEKVNIYNLGTDEFVEVNDSIKIITEYLGVKPELRYSGGERGWIGDNPFILLDCTKIKALGWKANHPIRDGIYKTLDYIRDNQWVLEKRL